MSQASARACANIALVKYWGKRDGPGNLPAAGSLSLTLAALTTTSTVRFDAGLAADRLVLDGAVVGGAALARLSAWLDHVRARAGDRRRAEVTSQNDFPTAAGLASSASAYASLTVAATAALDVTLTPREQSVLARLGSGSAARSIFGGFVQMHPGTAADGADAYAEPVDAAADWDLRMVIAVLGAGRPKAVSSRDAMAHSRATSPLHQAWLATVAGAPAAARRAIADRDLAALGRTAEHSALCMHAAALAARPPIRYWQAATLAAMDAVEHLRGEGVPVYFTIDAGPHVKALTTGDTAATVAERLRAVPGVGQVITSGLGGPAARLPS
jgi:diphosphomevalonate decarboxylase